MAEKTDELIDLFKQYFGGWVKDISQFEEAGPKEILVRMSDGRKYKFGIRKEEIFLETIRKSQEKQTL